ncbi:hypothetical protein TIFTF001_030849 [Ficus carica]|uniref:Uncharacterized protein n=1 Tax=Ficus carica TaxID=3494 RepID=A0AA88DTV8_FICCA|nr:hypothetical protein TIFTF001_030849 [Ficus carica]
MILPRKRLVQDYILSPPSLSMKYSAQKKTCLLIKDIYITRSSMPLIRRGSTLLLSFAIRSRWSQNPAWGSAVFAQIRSAYAYTMWVSYWRNLKTKINYLISEWKNVAPPAPLTPLKPHSPTYFCGALHWVFADKSNDSNCKILSFDLDEELHFHGIRISLPREIRKGYNLAMGVLRDCLSLCDNFGQGRVDIWMIKEYGSLGILDQIFLQ